MTFFVIYKFSSTYCDLYKNVEEKKIILGIMELFYLTVLDISNVRREK